MHVWLLTLMQNYDVRKQQSAAAVAAAHLARELCSKDFCWCPRLRWPHVSQQHRMQVQQVHLGLLSKLQSAAWAVVGPPLLLVLLVQGWNQLQLLRLSLLLLELLGDSILLFMLHDC